MYSTVHLGWVNVEFLRSSRIVPKLCRELPLIKLIMPPKGISMIHSYGEAIDLFVYKGISGGPTQLVAINSYGDGPSCPSATLSPPRFLGLRIRDLFHAIENEAGYGVKKVSYS